MNYYKSEDKCKKHIIDIEEVFSLQKRRKAINDISLTDIEWMQNGQIIKVNETIIKDWIFTGLSNVDFVICNLNEPKAARTDIALEEGI
jgi:hypothetical protein